MPRLFSVRSQLSLQLTFCITISLGACGDDDFLIFDGGAPDTSGDVGGADGGTDAGPDAGESGLRGGELTFAPMYEASSATDPRNGEVRPWVPVDLDEGTDGRLWVILRMDRLAGFIDEDECTGRNASTPSPEDDDCFGLQGATAAIEAPATNDIATLDGGRVRFVIDPNSLHFMRRPSAIAFGTPEVTLPAGNPGTLDNAGNPLIREDQVFTDIFATCPDTVTGNYTDEQPFIGPSLWTADPEVYATNNYPYDWSNGTHLDMVHATQYCTGLAWEQEQVYWALNGAVGSLDRYDFGLPHSPGHFYHDDATITRYIWPGVEFGRVEDVPSNIEIDSGVLYIADSGNARVIAMPLEQGIAPMGTFLSYEGLPGDIVRDAALEQLVSPDALREAWGEGATPSGLSVFDATTLVVADYTSGQIAIIDRDSGEIVRNVDTGLGAGIGGLTTMGGQVYFAHMEERRVYRIDVAP